MLKKIANYVDYDGNKVSETCWFHLKQTELIEFATELPDGIVNSVGDDPSKINGEEAAQKMMSALGGKGIVEFLKKLVIKAYGVRPEGSSTRFIKTPEITEEFAQSLAFDAIFMEMLSDENAASDFVNGIIPADVIEKMPIMQDKKRLPKK